MSDLMTGKYILAAIVYSVLGLGILTCSFIVFDKLTPGKLWEEIAIEKNLPLSIATAAFTIAIALIISSAIHG